MVGRRRVLAVLGAAAAGVLFSGCDLHGTADVISADEASIDLLISDVDFGCIPSDDPDAVLKIEPGPELNGSTSCHITGVVPLSDLGFSELHTEEFGEYWTFTGTLVDGRSEWPDTELEVRFPGEVVQANQGTVRGNTLVLNPGRLTSNELRVIALNRPGPATWVVAAAVGMASGVVLTLAVVGLLRHARRLRAGSDAAPLVLQSAGGDRAEAPAPRRPPTAPDAVVPPAPEALPVEVDHAWFATPPEESTVADAPPHADEPPDHSVWAPPEER